MSGDVTEANTEDNICKLLGLDIDKQALEIVKQDFKKKKIPWKNAGKFISQTSTAGKSVTNSSSPSKQTGCTEIEPSVNLKFARNITPEPKASSSRMKGYNKSAMLPTALSSAHIGDEQDGGRHHSDVK